MRRTGKCALVAVSCVLALTTAARAQTSDSWRFSIAPYGWMAGLEGDAGIGPVVANVDIGFSKILDALKFAAMAYGEARKAPWVLGVDGMYVSVGDSRVFAVRGDTGSFVFRQRETIVQPMGGYSFGSDSLGVDALLGARYWNLRADLDIDRASRPNGTARSSSRAWWDVTGGARLHWKPGSRLRLVAGGDVGAGGSDNSWQGYVSGGVNVWSRGLLSLAYRHLSVDYDHRAFLFDVATKGVMVSLTFAL